MKSKNKKTTAKKVVTEKVVIEPESILTEEEVKEIKEDEIVEVVAEVVEEITEEPTKEVTIPEEKVEKTEGKVVCRVVLATPTYYVINKNGVTITVNEKNKYRRGEEILK